MNKEDLNKHVLSHMENNTNICEERRNETDEVNSHVKAHYKETEGKCSKCDKVYSNMSKLRRHDWRSHRAIECNICSEMLNSIEEISNHRKTEHQMIRRVKCKYFPNCIDEEECFFAHEDIQSSQSAGLNIGRNRYCPRGESCDNQACEFSERNHLNAENVMCRFQAKCSRSECMYKHVMERTSFLGDCRQNFVRK